MFRAFALLRNASFFTSSQLNLLNLFDLKLLCFTSVADTAPQKLKPFRGIKREQECSSRRVNLFSVDGKETYAQALCFKIFSLFYFPYQLKKKYKNDLALALNISAISFNLPACAGCTESNRVANSKDSKQSRDNSLNLLMILRE